jgi:hypothetical protein
MASSIKPLVRTYKSSGAIKANSFVKFDTTSSSKNPTIVQCTSGMPIGISLNDADASSGDEVEVAFPGGGARLKISGTVTMGNSLKATTNGAGIATTTAGDAVGARAMESGVSGDIIGVHVEHFEKYNSDAN